ncbi:4662_t:CDS:1, partial [Gigaspora margarita]
IEPEVNNVVIYLDVKADQNKEFIDSVNFFKPIINPLTKVANENIIFNSSTLIKKRQIHPNVYGGSKLVSFSRTRSVACSAGFWMKKNGKDFILSAGHCISLIPPPAVFYLEELDNLHEIGPMDDFSIEQTDMGFIEKLDTSLVQLRQMIQNIDQESSDLLSYFIAGNSKITSTGIHVCKSGHVTGISCGKVVSINAATSTVTGTKRGLFRAELKNVPGDSGSSVYRYNIFNPSQFVDAVGILISGSDTIGVVDPIHKAFDL